MPNHAIWHLVYTKPHQEQTVKDQLEKRGYTTYLPKLPPYSRNSHSIAPLFPRYLFVRLVAEADYWRAIRSTQDACSLVCMGMNPVTISEQLVGAIRQYEETDRAYRGTARLPNTPKQAGGGDPTSTDCEAIFAEKRAENRVIFLLNLISKQHLANEKDGRLAII